MQQLRTLIAHLRHFALAASGTLVNLCQFAHEPLDGIRQDPILRSIRTRQRLGNMRPGQECPVMAALLALADSVWSMPTCWAMVALDSPIK